MPNSPNFLVRNLQWLLDRHGLNANSLAERLNNKPPQATLFRILNGESVTPRDLTIQPIADHFGIQLHELRYADLKSAHERRGAPPIGLLSIDNARTTAADERFICVPLLDITASCGDGKYVDHVNVKEGIQFNRDCLRDLGVPERAARFIHAGGSSMSPSIQDGRIVLLNIDDRTPRDGKVYAVCMPDGGLVLKRLILDYHPSLGADTWVMRSDNPDKIAHPDKLLPPDDRTMIVGRAVWNDNRL